MFYTQCSTLVKKTRRRFKTCVDVTSLHRVIAYWKFQCFRSVEASSSGAAEKRKPIPLMDYVLNVVCITCIVKRTSLIQRFILKNSNDFMNCESSDRDSHGG